jgi:hypothetical protein
MVWAAPTSARSAGSGIISRQFGIDPAQIKNCGDPPNRVILRNRLIKLLFGQIAGRSNLAF